METDGSSHGHTRNFNTSTVQSIQINFSSQLSLMT